MKTGKIFMEYLTVTVCDRHSTRVEKRDWSIHVQSIANPAVSYNCLCVASALWFCVHWHRSLYRNKTKLCDWGNGLFQYEPCQKQYIMDIIHCCILWLLPNACTACCLSCTETISFGIHSDNLHITCFFLLVSPVGSYISAVPSLKNVLSLS
jgi:hypothetical protein